MNYNESSRKNRGLHEKILLMKIHKETNKYIFEILSQTNKIYKITFQNSKLSCDCYDWRFRHKTCKHIFWLGCKKIGNVEPKNLTLDIIDNFCQNYSHKKSDLRKNETCGICLDDIDYDNEMVVSCENVCKNSVHYICWLRYIKISKNSNCIMCRSKLE